jgi:hypothetical protein
MDSARCTAPPPAAAGRAWASRPRRLLTLLRRLLPQLRQQLQILHGIALRLLLRLGCLGPPPLPILTLRQLLRGVESRAGGEAAKPCGHKRAGVWQTSM